MDSQGHGSSKHGKNGSFFEFSATSIHYWTTKSLNSLNKLTSKKKKEEPTQFISSNGVKTTTFGVEPDTPASPPFEHREFHSYEREDKIRRPSTAVSDQYATVGRQTGPSYTTSYYPRSNSMDRKVIYSTQDAFKSESKLDYDNLPSTSSRTWLPGEPITVYEERYESSSEVENWIQTQSIGTRLLDKHDRLILKHKDERDAIQKKTFTKWVNKHLSKSNRKVEDLYVDLRDGFSLIALLEALSGETLPRENGYTRFHRIQNVQYVLEFLRRKNIKIVNIRPEDIVEGNGKLTLGLIWTIILHFQVSMIKKPKVSSHNDAAVIVERSVSSYYSSANGASSSTTASRRVEHEVSEGFGPVDGLTVKEALLQWVRNVTKGYPGVNVTNFTNSWRDGLAFNAILHRYRPNLINWNEISDPNVPPRDRLKNAFDTADSAFGVSKLLDPEDVDVANPDEKSIITYVSSLYNALPHLDELSKYEQAAKDYEKAAAEWLAWTKGVTELMHDKGNPQDSATVRKLINELERFKNEDLPPMEEEKHRLFDLYNEIEEAFKGTDFWNVPNELKPEKLEEAWQELLKSMEFRSAMLKEQAGIQDLDSSKFQGNIDDIISRLTRGIGIVNEKLDLILKRIEDIEARADSMDQSEVKRIVQEIVDDLGALEQPINDLFDDVDILKAQNHPRANEFYRQVYGLHQRRMAYLDRLGKGLLYRLGMYTDSLSRQRAERTKSVFESLEEAIRWVRERLERLNSMVFHEDLEALEELFEQHKIDNRDIQDFHQTVKECIARQAEVSAEDSHEYCELLRILESEYQQLRDLSAGRMLDLDSLIAFIRAAQLELIWIHEREDIEVSRNWSDINQLDLPMLQNYYKQLLHEIELREKQFNDVHNQGAALINQRHPANDVIEVYLRSLQNQWDWLLGLTKCLEGHLRDALNLKSFQEEVAVIEEWIKTQTEYLENNYNRTDFTVEEGERWLRELNEIREIIQKYHQLLMSLAERSAHISPLWQRGERIRQPINVTAWCDYKGKDIEIRQGEDCTLIDNSDLLSWTVRGVDGTTAQVPSVVFRIPPPDPQLTNHLARLAAQLDKMRKLWDKKHRMIRYNMMMSTMKSIQGWDLDTFLSYPPEQRDEIIKALNDDVNKLLSEMDPNDPLALRLKEELKRTNDHFLDLLNQSLRGPNPDLSNEFDKAVAELLKKLEEAWKKLNQRTSDPVPKTLDDLERLVNDHRAFEDALQALDTDVSNVKELFRQLPNPTPTQRANHDYLNSRWEDLWELSRMYVERLKLLQQVLQGIAEVTDIVRRHEISLSSFDDMPAALDKLRGVHSQLLELNMVLQQQENIIHTLNQNAAKLRQHVARTRLNISNHPDVDKLEDEVSQLTVRWDNVCTQVADRLKVAEEAQHTQMVYRSQYDEEIQWLDRVENTINNLRRPEQLRPEELQGQLDLLMAEYSQLQEHTATIEDINKQGGKFIRDAKNYDNSLDVFRENIVGVHGPGIRSEFRRTQPQPKNGAQIVTEELEALNRRFAQLSSIILERRNQLNVLIQNWKRKQQEPKLNIAQPIQQAFSADDYDTFDTLGDAPDVAKMAEHEDEMQMYQEETVTKTQFYEMEGILHKQTGEILTFVEAIRQGLLDLSSGGGQFFDLVSGSKISLEKAAELGYINADVNALLNTRHGIRHPDTGEELTLLEAIQIGLYDPDSRQLRDIHTGEVLGMLESKNICDMNTQRKLIKEGILKLPPISLENAIQQGVINTETGQFTGKFSGEVMSIQDALYNEYIQLSGQTNPTMAVTLSDVIEDGLIDAYSGEFVDRNSGEKFTLRQALSGQNKLLSERAREVVNTQINQRVTVQEAIVKNAINLRQGNFTDLATRNSLNLRQAYDNGYIAKPMTLTEAVHKDAVDSANRFIDKGTKNRYTLLEAIANGVIDPDVRHIVDPDEKEVVSITEALERGLLDAKGRINLLKEQRIVDLRDAVREGLLSKRVHHTIFEVKGFKNTKTGFNLNFNEAVEAGILNVPSERVVDLNTNHSSSIADSRIVDPLVKGFLVEPCGIRDGSHELTLIRAVAKGLVDPVKGVIIHHNREISPREAYNSGIVTLRGALKLAALLDVHPTLMTPLKKHDRKKRIQRPGQAGTADDQIKVTLAEAMKQGLIDSRSQRFRQGNKEMSLHDAISQGLIDPTSEWVVPNRNSQVGPTIEEKIQETVTETGQQLAPKIFPDKQYEENVSTVKRVRRTETSAVGGPGGVSVYRAITGGKGSIEVPADGYHVREAERRGMVDLSTGIVSPPGIDKQLTLEEAFTLGVLNPKSISIKDPKSNRQLNALEAIEQKLIDRQGYLDYRGRRLTLQEAIDERIAYLEAEPPAHFTDSNKKVIQFSQGSGPVMSFRPVGQAVIEEHEQSWSFDASVGQLVDSNTGERLSLDAALRNGRIAPEDLRVRDAMTGREMTFEEAEKWGIIDSRAGYYLDKTNNQRLPFTEAARQHRIYPTGGVPENAGDAVQTTVKVQTRSQVSKKEAVNTGAGQLGEYNITKMITANGYDSQSGRFRHPEADKDMTLKELIVKGYLNPYATTVIDKRNNREVKLLDAIEEHIVDDINGTVKDTSTGREVDFRTAVNQGLIKEQTHDSIEGFLSTAGASVPGSSHSPRLVERKLQLTPYSQEPGSNRPQESQVSSFVRNQVGLIERRGAGGDVERLVDLGAGNQVMVKVIKGDDGIEKGEYVDPNTGMKFTIQLHGDPYVTQTTTKVKSTSQVQSIDLEPHAQFVGIDKVKDLRTGRVMSLQDAQRMGLARVDKKGKQATKSYSVFRSNIQLAVNSGVVDARGEKISLEEAIRSRVVDIQNLKYIHPKTNEPLDLSKAANMGLIDVTLAETLPKGVCHPANGEKISVQKAIELGIVNPRSGEVRNPFTNEKLSWVDLVKPVYASLTMEGIYDPKKGYGVPIAHAFNEGLIDTKTEQYFNSITGDRFSLADATNKGLIDQETHRILTTPFLQDYRTRRQLNLIQAVGSGLVDPRARTVKLNDNKIVSISQAVKEGAIPRDIGDRLRKADRLTFAEALGIGAVDVVADTFTDPDTGKQLSIAQAVQAGLLDTGDVGSVDDDNRNLAKILGSDEFDERSGRVRDRRSGMNLTFRAAVDQGVIDPDSLLHDIESSQTMTIREALNKNIVDGDGKYIDPKTHNKIGLNEANRLGLVALIASPMQAAQAVTEAVKRREAEGYKFKIETIDDGSHGGRPKFRDEQTIIKLTPRAQQPGLAAKFRSNVSESPRTSRRSMVDDAIALADLQNEFLDRLQQSGVNIDEPVIQNPSTMRNVSLREAVESGLLDVVNNEIIHPTSGRHYSLPKAAHMRLMNPESAEKLLKSLNLPTDELNQLLHPSTSTPVVTSYHYTSTTTDYPEVSYPSGSSTHEQQQTGDRKSWTREINWSGDAAELRKPGGDVKVHTFTNPDGSVTKETSSSYHYSSRD